MKKRMYIILLFLMFILVIFIYNNPFIEIETEDIKFVEVNSNYSYPKVNLKLFGINIKPIIKISSDLNIRKIGKYKIVYNIKFLRNEKQIVKRIKVIDQTKPNINLIGSDYVYIKIGDSYNELGVRVVDNYDGVINNIKIESNLNTNEIGEYEIAYTAKDSSGNVNSIKRRIVVDYIAPTYINGVLIVNKKYGLPKNYGSGINQEALDMLHNMQSDALLQSINLPVISAYRSYYKQQELYDKYYSIDGDLANTYSAKPGYSEHQTGLAFDVGRISDDYGDTVSGKWLKDNCFNYGFIIRYPKDKENITGYKYEPWHIRYVGKGIATVIMNNNLTLEEYLDID